MNGKTKHGLPVHTVESNSSCEKEWNTDTCYNIDEICKHNAKWNNPDMTNHILSDSVYIKCPD